MSGGGEVRLLVGFSQGSVSNIVGRLLAPALSEELERPVRVVQMSGENGARAAEALAQAAPDGLTLGMTVPTHLVGSLIGAEPRYDPLADFAPVAMLASNPTVLAVNPQLGVTDVAQLVELAQRRPGGLAYGASAIGGGPHLCAVQFAALTGLQLERRVYDETNVLFDDLASGRIALTFNNPTSVLQGARRGRLRMLAVTSAGESELVPGVPPLALSVPGYEYQSWVGVLAPAATPAALQDELHEAVQDAANSLAMRQGLHELGLEPVDESAAWFGRHLQREWERWRAFAHAHRAEFPGLR